MIKHTLFPILTLALLSMACGLSSLQQITSPAVVQFTNDSSRTASAVIGVDGGRLSVIAADGTIYELVIPPNALDFDETINMMPISAVEGLPLSGGLYGAVAIEPAGIIFYEPAILIITPPALTSGKATVGFAYDGTGEEFHLKRFAKESLITGYMPKSNFLLNAAALITNTSTLTVKLSVPSTRGYGVGSGTEQDVTHLQKTSHPKDPMDRIDQQLVDIDGDLQTPIMGKPEFIKEMSNTFNTDILPLLNAAKTSPALANKAFLAYDRWLAYVEEFDLHQDLLSDIAVAKAAIIDIIDKAARNSAERCFTEKHPEEAFAMQRWIRYARKFLPNTPQIEEIQARISKCLTFKVTFYSHITEQDGAYGYSYELNSVLTLKATEYTRATGSAPLVYSDGHWIGSDDCSFKMVGDDSTLDAESPTLGLSITPVSRTSPAVNITFRYDPGIPIENTSMACPGVNVISWTTSAWQGYFSEMHAEEIKGAGYEISSQITGAGSFTGWVFNNTTSGPSGQAVNEDTQIEIIHTPSR